MRHFLGIFVASANQSFPLLAMGLEYWNKARPTFLIFGYRTEVIALLNSR